MLVIRGTAMVRTEKHGAEYLFVVLQGAVQSVLGLNWESWVTNGAIIGLPLFLF